MPSALQGVTRLASVPVSRSAPRRRESPRPRRRAPLGQSPPIRAIFGPFRRAPWHPRIRVSLAGLGSEIRDSRHRFTPSWCLRQDFSARADAWDARRAPQTRQTASRGRGALGRSHPDSPASGRSRGGSVSSDPGASFRGSMASGAGGLDQPVEGGAEQGSALGAGEKIGGRNGRGGHGELLPSGRRDQGFALPLSSITCGERARSARPCLRTLGGSTWARDDLESNLPTAIPRNKGPSGPPETTDCTPSPLVMRRLHTRYALDPSRGRLCQKLRPVSHLLTGLYVWHASQDSNLGPPD